MNKFEITRDIVIKMLEEKLIMYTVNTNAEERNKSYVEEVCKAYTTVYQTVHKAEKGDFND